MRIVCAVLTRPLLCCLQAMTGVTLMLAIAAVACTCVWGQHVPEISTAGGNIDIYGVLLCCCARVTNDVMLAREHST